MTIQRRSFFRGALKLGAGLAAAGLLAACDPASLTSGGGSNTGSVQVALLVPSGAGDPNVANLAQNLINGAQLAANQSEGVAVDLRIYDTAGNADRAAQVAAQAVSEGADVIVGPLYAEAATAAGRAVASSNVAVLSFSNTTAAAGGNTLIMGATYDNTARRLLGYAKRQGLSRVMVVNGQDFREEAGRDAIIRAAQSSGVQVVGNDSFEMSQTGLSAAAPAIAASTEASGADMLFLTSETATALPILARALPENGLGPDNIQYLGLTRWDVPASAKSLPGLQNGWFTLPDTNAYGQFLSAYTNTYGSAPHNLAGLGYDGVTAVVTSVRAGKGVSVAGLKSVSKIPGANGSFRFLSDGTNQRALAVATIRNQQVVVIDAAPTSFGFAGF